MKKIVLALASMAAVLIVGAGIAFADVPSWGNVSRDNTGIVLYNAIHAAKGGEMAVPGETAHALMPSVAYGNDFPVFTSGDYNTGLLLAKGAEVGIEGSGAGGVISGNESMGTRKSFATLYPFPVNLARPIIGE